MALSSRTITASINYRCAPFSATLMHRGRRAALKTPSDACAEDCRGKLIWPRCPINACSPWCVPIITLPESVLTTKPRQRFSAVTCCTSNVNPPSRLRGKDGRAFGTREVCILGKGPGRQSGGFTTGSSAGKKSIFSAPLAIQIDKQVIEGGDGSLFHVGMPILVLIQDRQAEWPFMDFQ